LKLVVFLLLIGAVLFGLHKHGGISSSVEAGVEPIVDPVYAEVRSTFEARGREFEQVVFVKAKDSGDCEAQKRIWTNASTNRGADTGSGWKLKSAECKAASAFRYSGLFANNPFHTTYLSLDRGTPTEREVRILYWGVSGDESDRVCEGVAKLNAERKGAVECIRTQN
jgi:hypothetical protein